MPVEPALAMSFKELARLLPQRRRPRTIEAWTRNGRLNRRTGKRVKLASIRLPQGRGSSLDAYYEFLAELDRVPNEENGGG